LLLLQLLEQQNINAMTRGDTSLCQGSCEWWGVRSLQSSREGGHKDRSLSPFDEGCDHVKFSLFITALEPALHYVMRTHSSGPDAPVPWVQHPRRAPATAVPLHGAGKHPEFGVTLLLFNLGPFLHLSSDPYPSQPAEI